MADNNMVLITGGSGMIGSRLSQILVQNGYKVRILAREATANRLKAKGIDAFKWDVEDHLIEKGAFDGVKHIVHLAGENIGDKAWSEERKKVILDSRINAAITLEKGMKDENIKVETLICASAIGYYGNVPAGRICTEETEAGEGFQADVTVAWENAMQLIREFAEYSYFARIGIVLSKEGGALPKMLLPAKLGVSGLGSGEQMMSWVHVDDICGAILHLVKAHPASGTYNLVANEPVSNKGFMKTLAKSLGSSTWLPGAPAFAMRLVLGEMSQLVLGGSRVSNEKMRASGYSFKFPNLVGALEDLK